MAAETFLRMTALKHQYHLSDREVCALANDRFYRIPLEQAGIQATSPKSGQLDASGSDHMAELNARLVRKTQEEKLLKSGNKVRVDTTVVEANIHHPTSLIADTVRVVIRLAKKAAGDAGTAVR